jgi:hypothetical protein
VSDVAPHPELPPHGTGLLPLDLDEGQLAAAPTLESVDSLLIGDLSTEDDDGFFAALGS